MAAPHSAPTVAASLPRIGVLDTLRGIALIAMASYHFGWDLEFFGYLDPGAASHGLMRIYARGIASSFLLLVGVSLVLAHYPSIRWRSFWRRLATVVVAAVAITIATWFFTPDAFIFFGILHCIAAASLVGLAFLRLPWIVTLVVGAAAILLPFYVRSPVFDVPYLKWVGLSTVLTRSNDYVPMLPWAGVVLVGIACGRAMLALGLQHRLANVPAGPRILRFVGRHSLAFYLLHQPVLIALVYAMSMAVPPAARDPQQDYLASCHASCVQQGNDATLCTQFCACTLDRLQNEKLFAPLQSGAIQAGQNADITRIAKECTASSFPGN